MAKQYLMPYTNLHELNLDWLINAMKQLEASWEGAEMNVTATASATAGTPTVKVSGSLKDTLNFDFGLPKGNSYPSDTVPKADNGSGLVGVETTFARGDHVHPSDSTKLDKVTYSDETALYAVMSDTQVMLPYSGFATDSDVADLQTAVNTKQDILVSGTTIRTLNSNSLLGSGNIQTCRLWPLWKNASPTSEFPSQSIAVTNLFDLYVVIYKIDPNNAHITLVFITKDHTTYTNMPWGTNNYSRSCAKQTNEIYFNNAYSGSTEQNNVLVPYAIYGLE